MAPQFQTMTKRFKYRSKNQKKIFRRPKLFVKESGRDQLNKGGSHNLFYRMKPKCFIWEDRILEIEKKKSKTLVKYFTERDF